jgi:CRISPR-associated protein Csb2
MQTGAIPEGDWEIVRVLAPRSPISLKDLEVETSDLRRRGRIDPEGAQWWTYVRRPDCFTTFRASPPTMTGHGEGAQVLRFALSGKALPMTFDTLRWGELARQCAMSQYGRSNRGAASRALSGKDASGKPLTGHGHAFYLPTDEDGDGRLDHLTVWAPGGLTTGEFQAVASVNTLNPGGQREPVQLAYLAHGAASDFAGVSPLFSVSKSWRSLTPYVLPRHVKFRGPRDESGRKSMVDGPEEQISREVSLRYPGGSSLVQVEVGESRMPVRPMRDGQSSGFRPFDFFRYKRGGGSNGGGVFKFTIEFQNPVTGPVALGFACHQGLGVFVPEGG